MSLFEAFMLLCFGAAWPFSIYRSLKSRSTGGKSLIFMLALIAGYASGIVNKLISGIDAVLCLYVLNIVMVGIDAALWLRNRRHELREQKAPRCPSIPG
ncbi:hypothetical protein B5F40_02375 [Gordonibacter sp. An230]|uniref:hypothetical protein n=1 Tax=Gordonibacter sp. An230 TaxID=1965592 RepID=UPI000B3AA5F9|nr:hypothetical protein [Gordonibacter sp. An230]OUO91705.1 hypothetical protein B5F40_02375 [Gordonibacter sp. An230]